MTGRAALKIAHFTRGEGQKPPSQTFHIAHFAQGEGLLYRGGRGPIRTCPRQTSIPRGPGRVTNESCCLNTAAHCHTKATVTRVPLLRPVQGYAAPPQATSDAAVASGSAAFALAVVTARCAAAAAAARNASLMGGAAASCRLRKPSLPRAEDLPNFGDLGAVGEDPQLCHGLWCEGEGLVGTSSGGARRSHFARGEGGGSRPRPSSWDPGAPHFAGRGPSLRAAQPSHFAQGSPSPISSRYRTQRCVTADPPLRTPLHHNTPGPPVSHARSGSPLHWVS